MHCPIGCKSIMGIKTDAFQKHYDRLLRDIADTPKIDNHGKSVSDKTCSITKQKKMVTLYVC